MSLENRILEEEYILKLKELSQSRRSNYINRRYELIVRYMIDDQSASIFKVMPISDCYFQEIENYDQTPFILKTDLFTELAELDKTNHGGLIDEIESLKTEFKTKLAEEQTLRKDMNEGEKVERDQQLIAKFIENYGYDPTSQSVMTKNINADGLDMDLSENEEESEDEEEGQEEEENEEEKPKRKAKKGTTSSVTEASPNGDLAFLNQILEITGIDFKQVNQDIITAIPAPKPKRMTKKQKEEAEKKKAEEEAKKKEEEKSKPKTAKKKTKKDDAKDDAKDTSKEKTDDEKLKDIKKEVSEAADKAQNLVNHVAAKKKSESERKEWIDAAQLIAEWYRTGDKLHKSEIKANMIDLFLIKNYSDPKSMHNIGSALLKGVSIAKNSKQGAKFIKVAAEKYKYAPAVTALKRLTRQTEKGTKGAKKSTESNF